MKTMQKMSLWIYDASMSYSSFESKDLIQIS